MVLKNLLPSPALYPLSANGTSMKEETHAESEFAGALFSDTFMKFTSPMSLIMLVSLMEKGAPNSHFEWEMMFEAGSTLTAVMLSFPVTYIGGAPALVSGSVYHYRFIKNLSGNGYYCFTTKIS